MLVVEPSRLTLRYIDRLQDYIVRVLASSGIHGNVEREGHLLIVDLKGNMNDIDAVYALMRAYGISSICVAEQSSSNFSVVLSKALEVARQIIHSNESFKVEVIGYAKDYVPRDLEFALTASIIAELADRGVSVSKSDSKSKGGGRYRSKYADRVIRIYLTDENAYVCRLCKEGKGGVALGSTDVLCSVYSGLSALTTLRLMMQGFRPYILMLYDKDEPDTLRRNSRFVSHIASYLPVDELTLSYTSYSSNDMDMDGLVTLDLLNVSILASSSSRYVALPLTPIHDTSIVEYACKTLYSSGKVVLMPLMFIDEYEDEGISTYCMRDIEELTRSTSTIDKDKEKRLSSHANSYTARIKELKVKVTANITHDIIDAIRSR